MSFNIPNTFVAGAKAKADEVNENFESVRDEIVKNSQNLALIKEDLDYIKNDMMNDFITESEIISKTMKSKFCINYANVDLTGRKTDIFIPNGTVLNFKVGGQYPVLVGTNAFGDSETFDTIESVNVSGKTSGTYNLFLTLEGNVQIFNTRVYRSPKEPVGVYINDIWLMTLEPWCCYIFNGISWIDYEGIPLGSLLIEDGTIVETYDTWLNTQYLDSDCLFLTERARSNLSKRYETPWFSVIPNGVYTFEHNLNQDPLHYRARVVAKIKENSGSFQKNDIIETAYSNYSGSDPSTEVGYILKFNENTVTIGAGNSPYHCCNDLGGSGCSALLKSNVDYKIILTCDVN